MKLGKVDMVDIGNLQINAILRSLQLLPVLFSSLPCGPIVLPESRGPLSISHETVGVHTLNISYHL